MGINKVRRVKAEVTGTSVPIVSGVPEAAWARLAPAQAPDIGRVALDDTASGFYSLEYWQDMLPGAQPGEAV